MNHNQFEKLSKEQMLKYILENNQNNDKFVKYFYKALESKKNKQSKKINKQHG